MPTKEIVMATTHEGRAAKRTRNAADAPTGTPTDDEPYGDADAQLVRERIEYPPDQTDEG
jgi:hypothetical protein